MLSVYGNILFAYFNKTNMFLILHVEGEGEDSAKHCILYFVYIFGRGGVRDKFDENNQEKVFFTARSKSPVQNL